MRILAIGVMLLVCAGCATRWSKPGSTQDGFYSDRYQCEQEAANNYPAAPVQQMLSPGYRAPTPTTTTTNCVNVGYGNVQCQSTQPGASAAIYNTPPTYTTIDANASNRSNAVRSCLMSKGYRPG